MDIINSLIKKIDNIVKLTNEFDMIFSVIRKTYKEGNKLDPDQIENIYKLTKLYIFLRSEHGSVLIQLDRLKDAIKAGSTELDDALINKLYDLSIFNSIVENISNLISNIDFEYKRLAVMFPKYMNKKPVNIILLSDDLSRDNEYVEIIDELNKLNDERVYKIIECQKGEKINCGTIYGRKINIKIDKLPIMYMINEENIVELPIKQITSVESLNQMIE
jgi:hypothetical protein